MPYGRKKNMKGRRRVFTAPDKIDKSMKNGSGSDSDSESGSESSGEGSSDEDKGPKIAPQPKSVYEIPKKSTKKWDEASSDSETESESEEDVEIAAKKTTDGNPNHVKQMTKKVGNISMNDAKPNLTRKEREEIERQREARRYQALHVAGKTDEAKADLARLALIRQKRADDALKRAMDAEIKEEDAKAKAEKLKAKK
eukprot:CFRG6908T1